MKPASAAAMSAAATFVLTPLVRRHLVNHAKFDIPNHRSSHQVPTPRGGGIALALGALAAYPNLSDKYHLPPKSILSMTTLTLTGFADDQLDGIPASVRLSSQLITGAFLGSVSPFTTLEGAVVTAGTVNAINFMDGINGISSLTMAAWGGSTALLGIKHANPALEAIGSLTIGSALGFLPWNFPDAKIFLGDVGSYHLASLVASGLAATTSRGQAIRVALPLSLYIGDVTHTLARRLLEGRNPTEAHREHVYQRLVDDHQLTHTTVSAVHLLAASAISLVTYKAQRLYGPATFAATLTAAYLATPSATSIVQYLSRRRIR